TPITIFADDDVIWPSNMVPWLVAPFSDDQMGGVGTSQRALPKNKRFTVWEIIAAFRLSLRNIELTASTFIDGGVTCLSGRTAAYRTSILRDPDFQWEFTNEYWCKKYLLHSGDDKFLTRWMQSHKWKTFIQTHREATLLSTFKPNWRFLKQLMRWTRNSWRSDFKALFFERQIWKSHPFTAFTMFDKIFNPLTLYFGPVAFAYLATRDDRTTWYFLLLMFLAYIFVTRTLKYLPHLLWRPQDIFALPAMILFQYYFGFMKIYCLFTLHVTNWGTRTGADHKEASDITEIYRVHHEIYDDTEIPMEQKRNDRQLQFSHGDPEKARREISRSWRSLKRPAHLVPVQASQMAQNPQQMPVLPNGQIVQRMVPAAAPMSAPAVSGTLPRRSSIQKFDLEPAQESSEIGLEKRESTSTIAVTTSSAVESAPPAHAAAGATVQDTNASTSLSESIIQSLRSTQTGREIGMEGSSALGGTPAVLPENSDRPTRGIRESANSSSASLSGSWRNSTASSLILPPNLFTPAADDNASEVTQYNARNSVDFRNATGSMAFRQAAEGINANESTSGNSSSDSGDITPRGTPMP
ncbi:MAG: hypothetical protein SGCHY_005206, partial [Lobulomycetales sp.]